MRKLLSLIAVASFSLALLASPARAAAPPAGRQRTLDESLQVIDRLAADNIDRAGPGAAVAVVRGGKVVFQKGYGLADLEKKAPITTTTTFELASVSKPFTAFAVLILAERGHLALSDDVRKYVPELPVYDKKRPIRITNLLQHTSGLPTHLRWREVMGLRTPSTADFIKMTAQSKLDFPTGSKWAYSNMNYRLLAVIVERVSGKDFPVFLQDEVFGPLGMKHTFVRDPARPAVEGQAVGYNPGLGIISSWKYLRASTDLYLVGEAGVWSCVEDMARWELELRRPTLVTKASLERAWTAGKLDDGKPTPYGLGWFVDYSPSSGLVLSHSGGWPGFTTYFLRYPERDTAVIVLTNLTGNMPAIELALRSGNLLVNRPRLSEVKLTDAQLTALEGTYSREGKKGPKEAEVVRRKDGLYLVLPGQLPFPLLAESPAKFRLDGSPGERLVFEVEGGAVRRVRLDSRAGQPIFTFRPREKSWLGW